ncbi:hypothetical protein LZ012_19375 [Dechloromonas sp. XY25]|uniref:Uncharacterized protein n=1 Tax=Dechloromonas hankyongensis TaxID=2908002 RepID=A0ABS9K7L4_9RHOO|nr:hypothetical protein [Dechloromonas hankyongensis]MCG2579157.1 hypothetical protein [Dechloromonas hankyongensis]
MSTISIMDLPESVDLDREAMRAISGGARFGGRPSLPVAAKAGATRIVDYPPGIAAYTPADSGLAAGNKLRQR